MPSYPTLFARFPATAQVIPRLVFARQEEERRAKAAERVQKKLGVQLAAGAPAAAGSAPAEAAGSGGSGAVAGSAGAAAAEAGRCA